MDDDDSNFGAILHGSGAFAADGLSSTHTQHTLEPAIQLPVGSRCCFAADLYSFPLKPSNLYAQLDSTCQHHPFSTPTGVS